MLGAGCPSTAQGVALPRSSLHTARGSLLAGQPLLGAAPRGYEGRAGNTTLLWDTRAPQAASSTLLKLITLWEQ